MTLSVQGRDDDAAKAAAWLARRDRGLSPGEQDEYVEWMREARARGVPVADLERLWTQLDRVREWMPQHSTRPNPDLLAVARGRRTWVRSAVVAGLALAVLAVALTVMRLPLRDDAEGTRIVPGPERLALADGSVVELDAGSRVEVRFTSEERHVVLISGAACFSVARDSSRPFTVRADDLVVRAVGTTFVVDHDPATVAVIVTEGRVALEGIPAAAGGTPAVLAELGGGQSASVSTRRGKSRAAEVRNLTPAEIEASTAWRGIRLEFEDEPLADVIAHFNRFNTRQLELGDPATGRIIVAGSFRADNLDGFVRLLESGFNVTADRQGQRIVLRRR